MPRGDRRDILGGLILIAIGLFAGIHASSSYSAGTPSRMGPGMFPMVLGYLLAGLGLLVLALAFLRSGALPRPRWGPFAAVILATLAFALSVNHLGMVPAIALLTLIAAPADPRLDFRRALMLAAALSLFATVVFHFGLGVQLAPLKWPF